MITIIPPGETATFLMGSTDEELAAQSGVATDADYHTDDEQPAHPVTLTVPYAIGKFEITNAEFCKVLNWAIERGYAKIEGETLLDSTGEFFLLGLAPEGEILKAQKGILVKDNRMAPVEAYGDHPVNGVSWYGAAAFANTLSEMNGLDPVYDPAAWEWNREKNGYRLPTEAEWEYAARKHERRMYAWGATMGPEYNLYGATHPVGLFDGTEKGGRKTGDNTSPFGVYDMTGNVWEWCWDWYGREYYQHSPAENPSGPKRGDDRPPYTVNAPTKVWRGGGWLAPLNYGYLRIAKRWSAAPGEALSEVGFRIARTPV